MVEGKSTDQSNKIEVDQELCIGCGSCVAVAPDYFKLNDEGKSEVIKAYDPAEADKVKEAADSCPVQAITIK